MSGIASTPVYTNVVRESARCDGASGVPCPPDLCTVVSVLPFTLGQHGIAGGERGRKQLYNTAQGEAEPAT